MNVPLKGRLNNVPFPAVFAKIYREKKSGVLSLADPETKKMRKRIGFKNGAHAYVHGGTINETLGRLLLKWGEIDEKQYHESLASQKKQNKRTGEVLIEMKIFDARQLAEALRRQTEEKILGCFAWPDGVYSFVEAAPPEGKKLLFFDIRPEMLVMEGVRRYFNRERLENTMKPLYTAKFKRSEQFADIVQKMKMTPQESRLVQGIKDGMGFQDIFTVASIDPVNALQALLTMVFLGAMNPIVSKPADAPAQRKANGTAAPKPAAPPQAPPKPASVPPSTSEPVVPDQPPVPEMVVEETETASRTQPPVQPAPQQAPANNEAYMRFSIEGEDGEEAAPEIPGAKPVVSQRMKKASLKVEVENRAEDKKRAKEITAEIQKYEKIIEEGDFFELLGVDRQANVSTVKKAFFKLAKKFHPDTNPAFFRGEFRDRAEEVFTRIGEAYNTLIDSKAREEYIYALDHQISQEDIDNANKALEAEGIFIKAEILFKKGDFRGAQSLIEEAINLNPEEPEYYVYLGWCQYKSTRGAALAEARKTLQKSIEMGLRDKIDMVNYYLGMLAKVDGQPVEEQKKYFAAAVEANPHNTQAASELRHIEMRAQKAAPKTGDKKKGGLFGRFKK